MERKADDLCPVYRDKTEFLDALAQKTKVAIRMGQVAKEKTRYVPTERTMKGITDNRRTYDQLESPGFEVVGMKQTDVNMKRCRIALPLRKVLLNSANLSDANLRGATIVNCNLRDAMNCNPKGAKVSHSFV